MPDTNISTSTKFVSKLPQVILAIEGASIKGITKAAIHVQNKAALNLAGSRSGRTYSFPPGMSGTYTASAPGEFPALRLGDLRQSVHWKLVGDSGVVFTKLKHGAILEDPLDKRTEEEGTRKWLRRTFDEEEPEVKRIIFGAGNPASRKWF